eukprot:2141224-Lingulodinium_polyedra.AAC.1
MHGRHGGCRRNSQGARETLHSRAGHGNRPPHAHHPGTLHHGNTTSASRGHKCALEGALGRTPARPDG